MADELEQLEKFLSNGHKINDTNDNAIQSIPQDDTICSSPRNGSSRRMDVQSTIPSTSSGMAEYPMPNHMSLILEESGHTFRYATTMKTESHGGLRGRIRLPSGFENCDYQLLLSVVPSTTSKQDIHPCMLHVNVVNPESKQKIRTKLEQAKDWQVVINIDHGNVYYMPNYGTKEAIKFDCIRDGSIMLGKVLLYRNIFKINLRS